MKKSISIIGGDLRIIWLVNFLVEDGFDVYTFALDKDVDNLLNINVKRCNSLEVLSQKSDIIISSIPLSQDGKNVFCKYSDEKISLEELERWIIHKKFISGRIPKNIVQNSLINSYDLLENEEYTILNAIATAEGAIQIAMEEYPKTLLGSKILVMGFGRIGKIVSKMLYGIGADVYCEARKKEDLAYIKAYGYKAVELENLLKYLNEFDIIINNIPFQVLDKEKLDLLKKDVLIIDLASKPGGVDFEYAKSKEIKVEWALALPGKVAPKSCAEYIKNVIYNYI